MANILLVTCEHDSANMMKDVMRLAGHHVETVESGQEAIDAVTADNRKKFDLVFINFYKGGVKSGSTIAKSALQNGFQKIIIQTGDLEFAKKDIKSMGGLNGVVVIDRISIDIINEVARVIDETLRSKLV